MKHVTEIDLKEYEESKNQLADGPIGMLIIDKIGLKQLFYDRYHPKNNIDENITLMKESNMPNETKGNVIIGAHSGSGYIAFFNELHSLQIDDEIKIKYQQKVYTYRVKQKYLDNKDGKIRIHRDPNLDTLTLFTCNNNDKKNYLVVIAYKTKVNE